VAGEKQTAMRHAMATVWQHADQAAGRVMNRGQHGIVEPGQSTWVILDGVLAGDWWDMVNA